MVRTAEEISTESLAAMLQKRRDDAAEYGFHWVHKLVTGGVAKSFDALTATQEFIAFLDANALMHRAPMLGSQRLVTLCIWLRYVHGMTRKQTRWRPDPITGSPCSVLVQSTKKSTYVTACQVYDG